MRRDACDLFVPARTVADLTSIARGERGSVFRGGLRVRVRNHDLVASYSSGGRNSMPVKLTARMVEQSGGTMIVGRLHHRVEAVFRLIFWFATLFMAAMTIGISVNGDDTLGLWVCSTSAVLLGLVALGLQAVKGLSRSIVSAQMVNALHTLFDRRQV